MSELILNDYRYLLVRSLGSPGFIAQAYLAEALDFAPPGTKVVIKAPSPLAVSAQTAIEGLHHEAAVLKILNAAEVPQWAEAHDASARAALAQETVRQRNIIAGLDEGETSFGGWGYCVVQELAPDELKLPITGLDAELRALTLAIHLATAVDTAHKAEIALQDFEPNSKIDRLHAQWAANDELVHFKIIDWNISGGRPEIPNDVIFLNALIFALFTGYFPILVEKANNRDFAPFEPAKIVPDTWAKLSPATRILLERLVHPLPTVRPDSAAAVLYELTWLRDLLNKQASLLPADWVDLARAERERAVHVLMVAAIAQPKIGFSRFGEDLARLGEEAQRALIVGEERILSKVEDNLKYGVFREAQRLLEESLPKITHEEIAHQLRYRQQQTEFALAQLEQGVSPLSSSEYQRLSDAVTAMIAGEWQKADVLLGALPQKEGPVLALRAVVDWHLRCDSFTQQINTNAEHIYPVDEDARFERERLACLGAVLRELEQLAFQACHVEPALDIQVALLRQQIHDRESFLEFLAAAPKYLESAREAEVEDVARQWLRREPADKRASHLMAEAGLSAKLRDCVAKVQTDLESGQYQAAYDRLREVQKPQDFSRAAFERLLEHFKISGLQKEILDLRDSQGEARRKLAALQKRATDLGNISAHSIGLTLRAEEKSALEVWREIIQEAQLWLERHEHQKPMLPEECVAGFTQLQQNAKAERAQFLNARLEALGQALDAFSEAVERDAAQLLEALENFGETQVSERFGLVQQRFETLKTKHSQARAALERRDLDAALQAFHAIAAEPAVSAQQRLSVQQLLAWWDQAKSNVEAPYTEHQLATPVWPGAGELYKLMRSDISEKLTRKAAAAYQEKDWQHAEHLYELAAAYDRLPLEHQLQREQVQRTVKLIEEVNRLTSQPNSIDDLLAIWKIIPAVGQKNLVESLREQIERALETQLWATLPDAPQLKDLQACRGVFEKAYHETGIQSWRQTAMSFSIAGQFLTAKNTLDSQVARNMEDEEAYKHALEQWISSAETALECLKRLGEASTPSKLRKLAHDWQQALSGVLEKRLEMELGTIENRQGKPALALLDEILASLQRLVSLLPDSVTKPKLIERLTALTNQVNAQKTTQDLIDRLWEQVIQGKAIEDAEFKDAERIIGLASTEDNPQWVRLARLRWVNSARRVLQEMETEDNAAYARRLVALQAMIDSRPQSDRTWLVEDEIAKLEKPLGESLQRKSVELSSKLEEETESAFESLKKQVAAGYQAIEDETVEKVVKLLWQYAWYVEFASTNIAAGESGTDEGGSSKDVAALELTQENVVDASLPAKEQPSAAPAEVDGAPVAGVAPMLVPGNAGEVALPSSGRPAPLPKRGFLKSTFSRRRPQPKIEAVETPSPFPAAPEPIVRDESKVMQPWLDEFHQAIYANSTKVAMSGNLASWCYDLAAEIYRSQVKVAMGREAQALEEFKKLRAVVRMLKGKPAIELPNLPTTSSPWRPRELEIFDSSRLEGITNEDLALNWTQLVKSLQIGLDSPWGQALDRLTERRLSLDAVIKNLGLRYRSYWEQKPVGLEISQIRTALDQPLGIAGEANCLAYEYEREMALFEEEFLSSPLYKTDRALTMAQEAIRSAQAADEKVKGVEKSVASKDIKAAREAAAKLPLRLNEDPVVQWLLDSTLHSWWEAQRRNLEEASLKILARAVYDEYKLYNDPGKIKSIQEFFQPDDETGKKVFESALIASVRDVLLDIDGIVKQAFDEQKI